jgi:threonine dehydratase
MSTATERKVTFEMVQRARAREASHLRQTDNAPSQTFSRMAGCQVFLKTENLQVTGSFKARGALNKLFAMSSEQRSSGVITASAGNHGQGVAFAASLLEMPSTIVMPLGAPLAKVTAAQRYGARTQLYGPSYEEAHQHALELAERDSMVYVHAFDDPLIVAGQGVVAVEMLEQQPDLDVLVVPVGGGGLLAGMAVAARAIRPGLRLIGVQAAGAAACADSFRDGAPRSTDTVSTIADGIAVKRPGELTFKIIRALADDMVTVQDEAISQAIVLLIERAKLVVEGAGAVALAALLEDKIPHRGGRVGLVLSGGNIDLNLLGKVIQYGMISGGRYLALRFWLDDKPGQLHGITRLLAEHNINILHVGIHRIGPYMALHKVELELIIETRDAEHGREVLRLVRAAGYDAEEAVARGLAADHSDTPEQIDVGDARPSSAGP